MNTTTLTPQLVIDEKQLKKAALVFRAEEATGDALLEETATAAQAP